MLVFCFVFKKLLFLSCECVVLALFEGFWSPTAGRCNDKPVWLSGVIESVTCSFKFIFNSSFDGRLRLVRTGGIIRLFAGDDDVFSSSVNWKIGSANIFLVFII